jgi:hypothetical protein
MTNELTIEELKEKLLQQYDADILLELLDLSAEDLLERFTDRVEENYVRLLRVVE